jgi:hypothetical protein
LQEVRVTSSWFTRTSSATPSSLQPANKARKSPRKRRLEVFGEAELENLLLQPDEEDKEKVESPIITSSLQSGAKKARQDIRCL